LQQIFWLGFFFSSEIDHKYVWWNTIRYLLNLMTEPGSIPFENSSKDWIPHWHRIPFRSPNTARNLIQWKPLIMITLGLAPFDNNNWLITLSGGYKNLHYLTQFIVTVQPFTIKVEKLQFLPYGRSIGSWICLTHKTYTCHTVQSVTDTHNIVTLLRCTSMGVWGSMIY
jgi:hypothetical protein